MERSALALSFRAPAESAPVDWMISPGLVDYQAALACMDARVAAIAAGKSPECIWLLEHPSIYTAGTSAQDDELLATTLPVFRTGRGGRYTYHGPGQRIAYVMLDLKRRKPDVRAFVAALEDWIIATLADFGIFGERRQDRVGVWVRRPGDLGMSREDKIAALGIRLRHWVSFHGISINITPDLTYFQGIVPCGISSTAYGVTSFADLGFGTSLPEVDGALRRNFERIFGPTKDVEDRDR